jgi:hypothetical protein
MSQPRLSKLGEMAPSIDMHSVGNRGSVKRIIAREWLIFLMFLPFGFPAAFFLGYFAPRPYTLHHVLYLQHFSYSGYDEFWNHGFGLNNPWSLLTWLVPYLAVQLGRSIWSSLRLLGLSKRALCAVATFIIVVAVTISIVVWSASATAKRRRATAAAQTEEEWARALIGRGNVIGAREYLLLAADHWRTAGDTAEEGRVRALANQLDTYISTGPSPALKKKPKSDQLDPRDFPNPSLQRKAP